MKLNSLINPASLSHDIQEGLIRVQRHPELPLDIYNYTERAQFSRKWTKATQLSRGLIVNRETGDVVARPFPKFFNYEEKVKGIRTLSADEPVVVTDKMDGSLGILYPANNYAYGEKQYAIATRGSFISDQAVHATNLLMNRYPHFRPREGWTYLFEIIYPGNRIVVDYGDMDDLVMIGAVDIESGAVLGPEGAGDWPGPHAEVITVGTLREALSMAPRPGKEGLVVRSLMDDTMVKIKQQDYIELHRIVTGLNEREIWRRAMKADVTLNGRGFSDQVLDGIPDELHDWVYSVACKFRDQVNKMWHGLIEAWVERPGGLDRYNRDNRKAFALAHQHREKWLQKALWIMYDKNSPIEFLWNQVEPRGDVRP